MPAIARKITVAPVSFRDLALTVVSWFSGFINVTANTGLIIYATNKMQTGDDQVIGRSNIKPLITPSRRKRKNGIGPCREYGQQENLPVASFAARLISIFRYRIFDGYSLSPRS